MPQLIPRTDTGWEGAPSFGYMPIVYNGDPDSGGTVIDVTEEQENSVVAWWFNFGSGVILFASSFSGITDPTDVWIKGFRYIGGTGGGGSGASYEAESFTYTDTSNKVMGPLSSSPDSLSKVNLFTFNGPLQELTVDYTIRLVIGGSAPGYYICVSSSSTPPGGGAFSGGSNPGTGIDSILTNGDKMRVTYSS